MHVGTWPSAELPLSGGKGRSQKKSGPEEMNGRTADCDP